MRGGIRELCSVRTVVGALALVLMLNVCLVRTAFEPADDEVPISIQTPDQNHDGAFCRTTQFKSTIIQGGSLSGRVNPDPSVNTCGGSQAGRQPALAIAVLSRLSGSGCVLRI
jgi:hypothetical protein